MDGSGNVYVTGISHNGSNNDYLTVAYNSAGTELWAKVKNGAANGNDQAYALAVDGSGNVYVTGYSNYGPNNGDYLTVAYNSAGTELWAKVKNGAANKSDIAYALAVDGSGNVYVTGDLVQRIKLRLPDGGVRQRGHGAVGEGEERGGEQYRPGHRTGGGRERERLRDGVLQRRLNTDYLTVAYDSAGTELWAKVKNGAANSHDQAYALAVDGSGNVYVTGNSSNGSNADYLTVAYDSAGTELWAKVKNGAANSDDRAYALAVDGSGNVYVDGVLESRRGTTTT